MKTEIWKSSITLAGKYEVSSHGRVRSVERVVNSSFGATRKIRSKLVAHDPQDGNYRRINVLENGKYKGYLLHRLVAEVFVENPHNLPFINHIDGDKKNNHPDNLEWCTHQANMQHAMETGLNKSKKSVVCEKDGIGFWFPSQVDASRRLGISKPCICSALKGKAQATAGGYKWRYSKYQREHEGRTA